MKRQEMKSALEAILFVWGNAVDIKSAAEVFQITPKEAADILEELRHEYESRESGLMIRRIGKSYQICTRPEQEEAIRRFCTPVKEKKLSNAAFEVLAVIAYQQPVSRAVIDGVRGVKSERVIEGLVKRGLIEEKGRGEGLGRPVLYGTTQLFLEKFGISSLEELPELDEAEKEEREDARFQQISLDV